MEILVLSKKYFELIKENPDLLHLTSRIKFIQILDELNEYEHIWFESNDEIIRFKERMREVRENFGEIGVQTLIFMRQRYNITT